MSDQQTQKTLSHINAHGEATMVDVTDKDVTQRVAVAEGKVSMTPDTFAMIINQEHAKGDVLAVARIAGIQGAKKCADLIPLCHPLMLSKVGIEFFPDQASSTITIRATCKLAGRTGVEMEALTGVSVAALTLFDMCKAVDPSMTIGDIHVREKIGGKTGKWQHQRVTDDD